METEDRKVTNKYRLGFSGPCDTCVHGVATLGHKQCVVCLRRDAEVDAQIERSAMYTLAIRVLEDYQWGQQVAAKRDRILGANASADQMDAEAVQLQEVIDELHSKVVA